MDNKNSLKFFSFLAHNNPSEITVKISNVSDYTDLDAKFILKYVDRNTKRLDLASGSGLILHKICDKVNHITAVEVFAQFSQFITETERRSVFNQDISTFQTEEGFDIITWFGISQYFNESEISQIYKRYLKNINTGGKYIIKNQFGINEDIVIEGYSKELKTDYYSQYRHINKEVYILKNLGFSNIEVFDIYPPECNRWTNTHFYAIVACY